MECSKEMGWDAKKDWMLIEKKPRHQWDRGKNAVACGRHDEADDAALVLNTDSGSCNDWRHVSGACPRKCPS